jgi:hypothetical protein
MSAEIHSISRSCSLFSPLVFFFFPVPQSLSGILSLTYRKSFEPCSGFPNCEYGDFLILMEVILSEEGE